MAGGLSARDEATRAEQSSSRAGGHGGAKESLLRGLLGEQGTARTGRRVSENRGFILGINGPLGFLPRLHNPRQIGQSLLLRRVHLL